MINSGNFRIFGGDGGDGGGLVVVMMIAGNIGTGRYGDADAGVCGGGGVCVWVEVAQWSWYSEAAGSPRRSWRCLRARVLPCNHCRQIYDYCIDDLLASETLCLRPP